MTLQVADDGTVRVQGFELPLSAALSNEAKTLLAKPATHEPAGSGGFRD